MGEANFDAASFRKDMGEIWRKLPRAAFVGLDTASRLLEKTIDRNAPVDSGVTKESIKRLKVRKGKKSYSQDISIGSGDPRKIIGFIELGTKDEDANPFIRHSADLVEHKMIKIVQDEFEDI